MDFKDLYKIDFQLTDLFAMHQKWQNKSEFNAIGKPRRTDAMLYLRNCNAHYTFKSGEKKTFSAGSTVFLPHGSEYKTIFENPCGGIANTMLIEFSLRATNGSAISVGDKPFILRKETPANCVSMFNDAVDIYSASVIRRAELRSIIYSLLSLFSQRRHNKDILSHRFAPIAPAILYLEDTPCPTKAISELADMCHVSPAYLRRLFHEYASVSPIQYRNNSRIEYAKRLLEKNNSSISEIAITLGFEDTAYFCRVFKKVTGMTPGEYSETIISTSE